MPEPWPVHTVVFDLDDTLYPEQQFVLGGFAAVDAWLNRRHGIGGFGLEAERQFRAGHRGDIFDRALAALGAGRGLSMAELVGVYRSHAPKLSFFTEVPTVMTWARKKFRLGLISDGYLAVQQRKATALGLSTRLDVLIFSDSWGREAWKPSERPFRELMAALPGDGDGYVYIADNPAKDFIAPHRLGWRTVRVRRTGTEHHARKASEQERAETEIGNLAEIQSLLKSFF